MDFEYIPNALPGIMVLASRDKRVAEAVELLRKGNVEKAVLKLKEAKLDRHQIALIVATILRKPLDETEDQVEAILEKRKSKTSIVPLTYLKPSLTEKYTVKTPLTFISTPLEYVAYVPYSEERIIKLHKFYTDVGS